MKIASKIYVDNRNKSIEVDYTDGSRAYFGFEKFDVKKFPKGRVIGNIYKSPFRKVK